MENRVNNLSSDTWYFNRATRRSRYSHMRNYKQHHRSALVRNQRGQTAIIALLVLMLLAFAGAMFVTIVARSLFNAAHQTRVETADYYAEAGIRYADDQLTNSWEGADWRPTKTSSGGTTDPDDSYIALGYSRYNTSSGRFLINVTYLQNAKLDDSTSRYIKITSIGREGVVDPKDPTTFNVPSAKRVLVAYKAIGITDYSRFETNIDKRSDIGNLGVSSIYDATNGIVTPGVKDFYVDPSTSKFSLQPYPITTTYGAIDAYMSIDNGVTLSPNPNAGTGNGTSTTSGTVTTTYYPGGGALRSNSTVRFFGLNQIYLNNQGSAILAGIPGNQAYRLSEEIESSGDILLDQFNPTNDIDKQPSALRLYAPSVTTPWWYVYPSSSNFSTLNGQVRDGKRDNDAAGNPRSINRLDPPVIDANNSLNGLTRYRDMAIHSLPRGSNPLSSSQYGYGKIIYINNSTDIQKDSSRPGVGSTLIDEWLNKSPLSSAKSNWLGDTYIPPGADIAIGDLRYYIKNIDTTTTQNFYGIDIYRDDEKWQNPDNTTGNTYDMPIKYDDLGASGNDATNPNNDIIIVAEGNVRIHGIISSPTATTGTDGLPRHITIVTYGTAYIDGNILRGNPNSSIAILAKDYVCVNTSLFTAGTIARDSTASYNSTPANDTVNISDGVTLSEEFSFGLLNNTPSNYTSSNSPTNNLALYVEGLPSNTSNPTVTDIRLFDPLYLYPTTTNSTQIATDTLAADKSTTFDLSSATYPSAGTSYLYNLPFGSSLRLWVKKDQSAQQDLSLRRIAILPMDIRIEAMLYAQTKSFFVIPGKSFNTHSDDTVDNYATATTQTASKTHRSRNTSIDNDDISQQRYPFYNQPIDLKVTIYGSVSEAHPADIGAQTAWMLKWGWIPQYHGSKIGAVGTQGGFTGEVSIDQEVSGHAAKPIAPATKTAPTAPSMGLTIIYNPQLAYPVGIRNATGNPLPIAPRLPVCPGLLYSGEIPQLP